jgi:hypothetical protein
MDNSKSAQKWFSVEADSKVPVVATGGECCWAFDVFIFLQGVYKALLSTPPG